MKELKPGTPFAEALNSITEIVAEKDRTIAILQKQVDDMAAVEKPFNGLSPAEDERLAMLAEEAAEIVQECMKIARHGYGSFHPAEPKRTNRTRLMQEIGDFMEVVRLMTESGDVTGSVIADYAERKRDRMRQYAHHQTFEPEVRADEH